MGEASDSTMGRNSSRHSPTMLATSSSTSCRRPDGFQDVDEALQGDLGVALNGGCGGVVSSQFRGVNPNLDRGGVWRRDAPLPGGHAAEAGANADDQVCRRNDAVGAPVGVASDDAHVEGMVGTDRVSLPLRVVATGMVSISASCATSSQAPEAITPEPEMMTGRRASDMSRAASFTWSMLGSGLKTGYRLWRSSTTISRSASA